MFRAQPILTKMATLVRVGDVCGPILGKFDAATSIWQAANVWQEDCQDRVPSDPMQYICLVTKAGKHVGWLDFSDLVGDPNGNTPVETCMTPIDVNSLVTADTPLIDAMKMFDSQSPYCLLVMNKREIVGAFSYQDLLSIPFRLCLFATLLSVEQALVEVAQTAPALAVSKLKDQGKRVAIRMKKVLPAGQKIRPYQILDVLYFSEVIKILQACSKTARALTALNTTYTEQHRILGLKSGAATTQVKSITKTRVDQAIELRNALAHPNQPWRISMLLPKEDLKPFLTWLTEFERQLTDYMALGNKLED